jgi:hypothetical protein
MRKHFADAAGWMGSDALQSAAARLDAMIGQVQLRQNASPERQTAQTLPSEPLFFFFLILVGPE